jgi:hypothetical protein
MARDEKPLDKGRVKVRVIEFELDGSNQTLRDSIRDIVGAIGGRPQISKQQNPAALGNNAGKPTNDGERAVPNQDNEGDDSDETIIEVVEPEDGVRQQKRRSPPRTPQILDLDFKSAAIPLTDFCAKLNPDSDNEKYIVIAYWLKHFQLASEVTADHIHTGFRHMKWNTPAEAGQPLRNLKTRSYGYLKAGSKPGAFVVTHIGDNHVLEMAKAAGIDL